MYQRNTQVWHLTHFRTRISHVLIVFFFLLFFFLLKKRNIQQLNRATSYHKFMRNIFIIIVMIFIISHHYCMSAVQQHWYIFVFSVTVAIVYNTNQTDSCLSVVFICRHSFMLDKSCYGSNETISIGTPFMLLFSGGYKPQIQ